MFASDIMRMCGLCVWRILRSSIFELQNSLLVEFHPKILRLLLLFVPFPFTIFCFLLMVFEILLLLDLVLNIIWPILLLTTGHFFNLSMYLFDWWFMVFLDMDLILMLTSLFLSFDGLILTILTLFYRNLGWNFEFWFLHILRICIFWS